MSLSIPEAFQENSLNTSQQDGQFWRSVESAAWSSKFWGKPGREYLQLRRTRCALSWSKLMPSSARRAEFPTAGVGLPLTDTATVRWPESLHRYWTQRWRRQDHI